MTVLETIRLVGKEFEDIDDVVIENWIILSEPFISKKVYGRFYNQAVAYLTCHKMKMAGVTDNSGTTGSITTSFGIGSISDGGTSISFNNSSVSSNQVEAEYSLTSYGIQLVHIRKLCVIPIHISGEGSYAEY